MREATRGRSDAAPARRASAWCVLAPALVAAALLARRVALPPALADALHVAGTAAAALLAQRLRRAGRRAQALAAERTALRDSEATFRLMFASSPQPMWVFDTETLGFLAVNDAAVAHYGYSREEFSRMTVSEIRPPEDVPAMREAVRRHGVRLNRSHSWRHRLKDGRVVDVEVTSHPLTYAGRSAMLSSVHDVTERKRLEEELRAQAFTDSLTGLANRALLRDRIDHALARRGSEREPLAVLLLDLDGFKTLNDSLGPAAGDELLLAMAGRVCACVRPSDTVARLGGDEFVVLLEGGGGDDATRVAARIAEALQAPFDVRGRAVAVRASMGIATATSATKGAEELLRDADVAMYRAKDRGEGGFEVFEPHMHAAVLERLELETDLRKVLQEGTGLVLHYQPTVALGTGEVAGVEALVRWEHPRRGLVPPLEFIPLAEQTGLIVALGRWVLEEACCQARRWEERWPSGWARTTNVNVSARQLLHPGFVADVARALETSCLPPSALTLEITESVLVDDAELAVEQLRAVKALGVNLAIDDFGTGYSSLSYLERFPVDVLKVDKCFVDTLRRGSAEPTLARAIIQLGHALGLHLVAEGIEAPEQADLLAELRCHVGQGYLFSRPLPAAELDAFLAEGAAAGARPRPLALAQPS